MTTQHNCVVEKEHKANLLANNKNGFPSFTLHYVLMGNAGRKCEIDFCLIRAVLKVFIHVE